MYIEGIDEIDNKIIEILKKDARLSYSEIGEMVGVSRVSVKNRMKALEEKGVILGYKAVISHTPIQEGRTFYIEGETEAGKFEEAIDWIAKHPMIRKVSALTGRSRFIAEGYTRNNSAYETFMRNIRQNLTGITGITVNDVVYRIKDVDGGVEYKGIEKKYY